MSFLRAAVGPCLRHTLYSLSTALGWLRTLESQVQPHGAILVARSILGLQPGSGHLGSLQSLRVAAHRSDLKGSTLLISFKEKVWCSHSYQVTGTGS